jgi:hypothetical protein
LFNIKVISLVVGCAALYALFAYDPQEKVEPLSHQIKVVSVTKLEPFGRGSVINDFCGRCTMITDSQLNTYFTSGLNYADAIALEQSNAVLIKAAKQIQLCTLNNKTCMVLAGVNKHGLSNLPVFFEI